VQRRDVSRVVNGVELIVDGICRIFVGPDCLNTPFEWVIVFPNDCWLHGTVLFIVKTCESLPKSNIDHHFVCHLFFISALD
jgi:hypothetical protein